MIFKLGSKSILEQTYTFFVIIWDIFVYNQILQLESNFILFCTFNCVTFSISYSLNSFVDKFWSSRRKPCYQYHFSMQLEKVCKVGHKNCERLFEAEELSSVQNLVMSSLVM